MIGLYIKLQTFVRTFVQIFWIIPSAWSTYHTQKIVVPPLPPITSCYHTFCFTSRLTLTPILANSATRYLKTYGTEITWMLSRCWQCWQTVWCRNFVLWLLGPSSSASWTNKGDKMVWQCVHISACKTQDKLEIIPGADKLEIIPGADGSKSGYH